ncbi:hypothetical protein AB205_0194950 [Aquarana catesbeiana]|uniref:G-protein coupled receptors family 1 profile domain-containing protein n=1 Tax=Aquarana catesbeiana TaxID=8400 RepID=A0A2G9QHJ8_AQUCT|nr:hypothetical protein AB205_0194950 [Aquarana catesbeiana]
MYFIPFLSTLDSGILMAMAVDRYVAICHPLRYSSILTNQNITKFSLIILANLKAISTCAAHICAVLIYYIPLIGLSVVHRYPSDSAPNIHILFETFTFFCLP